jgi:choline-sulfatase
MTLWDYDLHFGMEEGRQAVTAAAKLAMCAAMCAAALAAAPPTPVILISIDTLRADRVGAYGGRSVPTPGIDSFAAGGTLFSAAEAQAPLTLPSHTSLLTSTYPFQSGVEENAEHVPANLTTLAGVLRAHGYQTAAFIGSIFLERQLGLDGGFDFYDSPFQFDAFSPLSGEIFFVGTARNRLAVRSRRDGYLVIRAAERWLNERRGQAVFAFVHLFDLHAPYELPGSFQRPPGVSDYAAQLVYVDRVVAAFREALIRGGWWDRSLVVLVSDHGEGLGDHGENSHGSFLYESTLHVPLVVHWPSGAAALGAREDRPAGLIDVAPAILDFLHIPAPPSFVGLSLLKPARGPVFSESQHAHDAFGWAALRALRSGDFKYIDAPHPELYDLRHDPGEERNLIRTSASRAQELRAEMSKLLARYPPAAVASPDEAVSPGADALLRSLGYLSRGPRRRGDRGAAADPKDRLAELHLYEKAEAAEMEGRLSDAAAILNQVLAGDPENTLARRDLGVMYVDLGLFAKARECFEKVLADAPDDYLSHYELGVVNERLGRRKEALDHLQVACELAPRSEPCRAALERVKRTVN